MGGLCLGNVPSYRMEGGFSKAEGGCLQELCTACNFVWMRSMVSE